MIGSVACALIVQYLSLTHRQFDIRGGDIQSPLVMAMGVSALLLLRPCESTDVNSPLPRVLSGMFIVLGRASLGIFLSHIVFLEIVMRHAFNTNLLGLRQMPLPLAVAVIVVAVTGISWCFTAALRAIPGLRNLV